MNFVINRTDAIGDFLLTLPMAEFLKKVYPNATVSFIVSARNAALIGHCPYIDDYLVVDAKESFLTKLGKIKKFFQKHQFQYYFYVGGDHTATFLAALWGIPFRGGLKSRWPSFLFLNKGLRQSRSMVEMHERDYNLQLLKTLEAQWDFADYENYVPKMALDKATVSTDLGYLKQELELAGYPIHLPWVFIHPGMTGHTLNWPSENYAKLILRMSLKSEHQLFFFISHTPADEQHLRGLKQELSQESYKILHKNIYYFNGAKMGLTHYLSILSHADLFIGPSTGTTHLANTLNIPLLALYSPIKVQSSLRWGPLQKKDHRQEILYPDVICGEQFKCAGEICPYYECMEKIEVNQVADKALKLLKIGL